MEKDQVLPWIKAVVILLVPVFIYSTLGVGRTLFYVARATFER